MAGDKSLKDLAGAVVTIAEHQRVIKTDVKDIRDAICNPSGILDAVNAINERLDKAEKKARLEKLRGRGGRTSELNARNLLKNTDNISNNLAKILKNTDKMAGDKKSTSMGRTLDRILDQVRRISGRRGEEGSRRLRLTGDDLKRDNKKMKELQSISRSVDIMERLRGLKLRDFMFTKRKLKKINGIISNFHNMFKNFKNQKEVDGTLALADQSIELVQKLKKIALTVGLAKTGERGLEKLYLGSKKDKGKGGLLYLFREISKPSNVKAVNIGTKSIGHITKACGSMLLTSIALTAIAVVGIPAMLGALAMKGIVLLMIGTFTVLSKAHKQIDKGSMAMLAMSTSILAFSLGLGLMTRAVRNLKLKDIGLMIASIAGMGLTIAGVGLLAVPISIGSASLLLMGASLGVFGLALIGWQKLDGKKAAGNIKDAIGGIRDALGLELGNHGEGKKKGALSRIGGGILDLIMAALDMGSMFFMMGTLLFAGVALGFLYHGLKRWDNYNGKKAAANIGVSVGALKDVFGLNETKGDNKTKFKVSGGKLIDFVTSIFQAGGALVQMGTIMLATMMSDVIRVTLIPWNKYDARPAANNLKIAVNALKDVFGLGQNMGTGFGKIDKLVGGTLDFATTLMQAGGTLVQMGTIMLAVGMSDVIKLGLKSWDDYDPSQAIGNMSKAVTSLNDLFGLNIAGEGRKVSLMGGILEVATSLLSSGGTLAQMGTIALATGMLSKIQENLEVWRSYDSAKPIANVKYAIDNLLNVFGLSQIERMEKAEGGPISKAKKFFGALGNIIKAPFEVASNLTDAAVNLAEGGKVMTKISNILHATSAMYSVKGALEPWDEYDSSNAFTNIKGAITHINSLFTDIADIRSKEPNGLKQSNARYFEISTSSIKKGITNLANSWKKSEVLKSAEIPFKKTVDIVNAVDIEKASTMIEMFKSFSDIKKKPFDKFTESVNKFAESSSNLIDALNNFSGNYSTSESTGGESGSGETSVKKVDGVNINNAEALAKAVAEAMRALPINIETSISDIRLVVNGESGRRVVVTLDN